MIFKRLLPAAIFVAVLSIPPATPAHAEADAEGLINALNAVFGKHDGLRAAHTHGFCVKGSFVPTAEAANLTKAPHFNSKTPVGVIGRFSMGGGDPMRRTHKRTTCAAWPCISTSATAIRPISC